MDQLLPSLARGGARAPRLRFFSSVRKRPSVHPGTPEGLTAHPASTLCRSRDAVEPWKLRVRGGRPESTACGRARSRVAVTRPDR